MELIQQLLLHPMEYNGMRISYLLANFVAHKDGIFKMVSKLDQPVVVVCVCVCVCVKTQLRKKFTHTQPQLLDQES